MGYSKTLSDYPKYQNLTLFRQGFFLLSARGGASKALLYNFKTAHDTATKNVQNNVLPSFDQHLGIT